MNDRFKFRLWDKELNKYVYKNLFQNNCCEDENFQNGTIYFDDELTLEQPEQCTGLKDKNGKLVFEGDLVKTKSGVYGIMWLKGQFNAVGLLEGAYLTTNINNIADGEIIGNIHENSDLLK